MTWGQLKRSKKRRLAEVELAARETGIHGSTLPRVREHYLGNKSVKAVSLREVSKHRICSKREAIGRAENIDLLRPYSGAVNYRYEEKPNNRGYRLTVNLPLKLRLAQTMAKELIRAQHVPAEHIFDWPNRGGCPGAVARTGEAIERFGRYVVVADISDCYSSFDPDYLYQTNLLPSEFIRAALDSRELRYNLMGKVPFGYDDTEQTRPRGLLQGGAASSSFLAFALNDLPEHLPDNVVPITQSDNIIIVCRSRVECEAANNALGRYLRDNPAGAFSPRTELVWLRNPLDDGDSATASWPHRFEQFGYSFSLRERGECEVGLSHANIMKVMTTMHDYLNLLQPQQASIDDFDDELRLRLAGFPALTESVIDCIAAMLQPDFVQKLLACDRHRRCESDEVNGRWLSP